MASVEDVVDKLDEFGLIRKYRVTNGWYRIYCPFHNDGNEKKPSCGVLLQDEVRDGKTYTAGMWHCFACGASYDLKTGIQKVLDNSKSSSMSANAWLEQNVPGFVADTSSFDYLVDRESVKKLNSKFALDYLCKKENKTREYVDEKELQSYRYTTPYMYERKLTDEVIEKFDVGVDLNYIPDGRKKKVPTITFPVRDKQGRTLFVYRRSIATKGFYMPKGIEKPVYGLYELPKHCQSLILCESIFNALTCYVYGKPAVALLGTGTPKQIEQLKLLGVNEFVLGLDPDEAGNRGCDKLKRALSDVAFVRKMEIPTGKDINDLTKDEFYESYESRI